jgi:hypothetical protein
MSKGPYIISFFSETVHHNGSARTNKFGNEVGRQKIQILFIIIFVHNPTKVTPCRSLTRNNNNCITNKTASITQTKKEKTVDAITPQYNAH